FDDEIEVLLYGHREHCRQLVCLAIRASDLDSAAVKSEVARAYSLLFVENLVGRQCVHERQRHREVPRLPEVQKRIMGLSLGFEITRFLQEPIGIVPQKSIRVQEKSAKFPVRAHLLQDQ